MHKRRFLHLEITIVSLAFVLFATIVFTSNARSGGNEPVLISYTGGDDQGDCLSEGEVAEQVNGLLIRSVADQAQLLLVNNGKKSSVCRKRVVSELVKMMSQHTEIDTDLASSNAWLHGAEILADLKPVEALDFLISHLTLWDGTSGLGPRHLPAVGVIIKIGSGAIPKLSSVLKSNPDVRTRMYATYCLGQIGGPAAARALTDALPGEADPCVGKFMKQTIDAFRNRKLPNHITSRDRTSWLVAFNHGC
jgi:hypothetical protein